MVHLNPDEPYVEALDALEAAQEWESPQVAANINLRAQTFATLAVARELRGIREALEKLVPATIDDAA